MVSTQSGCAGEGEGPTGLEPLASVLGFLPAAAGALLVMGTDLNGWAAADPLVVWPGTAGTRVLGTPRAAMSEGLASNTDLPNAG